MERVRNLVWSGDTRGLYEGIEAAKGLDVIAMLVKKASLYYSFASGRQGYFAKIHGLYCFLRAKSLALRVVHLHSFSIGGNLTLDQVDVISTILVRSPRMLRHLNLARNMIFDATKALVEGGYTLHSLALLYMTMAEISLDLGDHGEANNYVAASVGLWKGILEEPDTAQAHRQLARIYRRAYVVCSKTGAAQLVIDRYYLIAEKYASHSQYGTEGLIAKLHEARRRLERR